MNIYDPPPRVPIIRTNYLENALTPKFLQERIDIALTALRPVKFDSVAFQGISGALVAPILAYLLQKTITVIRKPGEGNHSGLLVEGNVMPDMRYIIVDDFAASGSTLLRIREAIHMTVSSAVCVGAYFYARNGGFDPLPFRGLESAPNPEPVRPQPPISYADLLLALPSVTDAQRAIVSKPSGGKPEWTSQYRTSPDTLADDCEKKSSTPSRNSFLSSYPSSGPYIWDPIPFRCARR